MKAMNKKHDIIVGIDPDIDKSGVAIYYKAQRQMEKDSLEFPDLLVKLYDLSCLPLNVLVVVEAGWLNEKSNFHGFSKGVAENIARKVGSNQQTGKHTIEMCQYFGLEVIEQKPFEKTWKGKDRKITHEEINYILESNKLAPFKQTNQEVRDALLICINHAGLILRVKV
ncbi:MAG: hypothetical protein PHS04_09820 [Tissierellia bacterium]|nr:hypothetical protein [Tissierellia bacterium]